MFLRCQSIVNGRFGLWRVPSAGALDKGPMLFPFYLKVVDSNAFIHIKSTIMTHDEAIVMKD